MSSNSHTPTQLTVTESIQSTVHKHKATSLQSGYTPTESESIVQKSQVFKVAYPPTGQNFSSQA